MRRIMYETMDNPNTYVPHHMRDGFRLWIERGIPPGSFGIALLSNDLKMACAKADTVNCHHIFSTVSWLWNYAPFDCWGSAETVAKWRGLCEVLTLTKEDI